jgi:2'-5' RNA ligase
MSRLVVIAYPNLSAEDFDRIQAVRADHDELYFKLVNPHITLVFPTEALPEAAFTEHVRSASAGVSRIPFTLRCAVVWDDATQPYWHVFLVPEEGFSATVRLHDRLYTGSLSSELRLDTQFIPHLGVGTSRDPQSCKALADRINADGPAIAGTIDRLDVALLEPDRVRTIDIIDLG